MAPRKRQRRNTMTGQPRTRQQHPEPGPAALGTVSSTSREQGPANAARPAYLKWPLVSSSIAVGLLSVCCWLAWRHGGPGLERASFGNCLSRTHDMVETQIQELDSQAVGDLAWPQGLFPTAATDIDASAVQLHDYLEHLVGPVSLRIQQACDVPNFSRFAATEHAVVAATTQADLVTDGLDHTLALLHRLTAAIAAQQTRLWWEKWWLWLKLATLWNRESLDTAEQAYARLDARTGVLSGVHRELEVQSGLVTSTRHRHLDAIASLVNVLAQLQTVTRFHMLGEADVARQIVGDAGSETHARKIQVMFQRDVLGQYEMGDPVTPQS